MIGSHKSGGETPSNYRRRVFSREKIPFKPNSFNIKLGQANVGRVINLSEGGLAVRADANSIGGLISQIRFKFSESDAWIETGGKVIWSDSSTESAGIEFIGLPPESREQIRDWISEVGAPESGAAIENALQPIQPTKLPDPLPDLMSLAPTYVTPLPREPKALMGPNSKPVNTFTVFKEEEKVSSRRLRLVIGICAAILLVGGLVVFLPRFLSHKIRPEQPITQDLAAHAAAGEVHAPLDKLDPSDPPASPSAPSKPIAGPQQLSGFVLQAGAMAIEKNAKELSDTLRQQNFHVFLSNSNADHLFRVYVGPFPDRNSALNTKTSLQSLGITSILRSWAPPAKP
jgi:hypothetical protein